MPLIEIISTRFPSGYIEGKPLVDFITMVNNVYSQHNRPLRVTYLQSVAAGEEMLKAVLTAIIED